jgi:prepilin-type N-terminal cleavage/methylation domain-containing protein
MKRRVSGFTLIEVMIALAIVGVVIAAASTFFIGVVRQYKVQTKITESNVEGIIGLQIFRQDLETLGFGLPWNGSFAYTERTTASAPLAALNDAPSNAPRAIVAIDSSPLGINNGSDYLVIKSTRVGTSDAAGKWTTLRAGPAGPVTRTWGGVSNAEDLASGDRVIVLSPGGATSASRVLLTPVGGAAFNNLSAYEPIDTFQTNIVYGIDTGTLQRPFNRAEYFIAGGATPQHCAPNTGVLVKAVVLHDGTGSTPDLLPLIDCAADMQVMFGFDTTGDRQADSWSGTTGVMTADQIRTQLVEVRVNLLVQQGQRDDSYRYPNPTIYVGDNTIGGGHIFPVDEYRNYRWKQYSIVVRPRNLAN